MSDDIESNIETIEANVTRWVNGADHLVDRLISADIAWLIHQFRASRTREAEARKALEKIAKGEGRYSRDPQQFANNVIAEAIATAEAALAGAPREDET